MIVRSVVGKLWITFLLLVSFVLSILTIMLLEFFEDFHIAEAEKELMQTAAKVTATIEDYDDRDLLLDVTEHIKDPSSRMVIYFSNEDYWFSSSTAENLPEVPLQWLISQEDIFDPQLKILPNSDQEVMIFKTMFGTEEGAVFVYQSLDKVKQTTKDTTRIILLAAGIAIILTTIFAFFLSTRITSPLIKMREGAMELAKGEFNTKVPVLTHDEIGELAMAFNRMGRQLKYHINALRQEKEQLYSILSSMADGVITFNSKANILVTNPPAEKFLSDWNYEHNLSRDEKQTPEELKKMLEEVIQSEQEKASEVSIQGRNWVVIMTPLYDQTNVRGAVAVIRDMTEERRMDQMRDDFIANVSHELRTPISMLQGYSEAIVDDIAESKEEKNELAKIIHDESLRIGRLVNELLDLARMKAGHITLHVQTVEIYPFVNRILRKFQGLAKEKNILLQLDTSDDESQLAIDPDRIEQVLTNLIDNAITHTDENGEVTVSIKNTEEFIQFSIKDNGSGIPPDDIPFVFERFYKVDKSRKRKSGKSGTGLGLAIAKNIVEAHNGSINVQSKQGEGTTFNFLIPKNIENH